MEAAWSRRKFILRWPRWSLVDNKLDHWITSCCSLPKKVLNLLTFFLEVVGGTVRGINTTACTVGSVKPLIFRANQGARWICWRIKITKKWEAENWTFTWFAANEFFPLIFEFLSLLVSAAFQSFNERCQSTFFGFNQSIAVINTIQWNRIAFLSR